jgi:hypothetical protein
LFAAWPRHAFALEKPKLAGTSRCDVPVAERSVRRRNRVAEECAFSPHAFRPDGRGLRSAASLPLKMKKPAGKSRACFLKTGIRKRGTRRWPGKKHGNAQWQGIRGSCGLISRRSLLSGTIFIIATSVRRVNLKRVLQK